ncbi:MAG: PilZ domain-containing protein [Humidesulfovibrio sp.]|uniref:PilZ domain-containing protein n=1 Tax=Humidesulfovibrio sp. TaxID=2910988 RepID=UPI0027340A3F|nr:PilZ domain-containing protein [Humidesulfovibrio sp.]MDP2848551.1 PilZ domain-containing protein [Humidesulfovibrio sp.]
MDAQQDASLFKAPGQPAIENPEASRRVERLPGVHLQLKVGNQLFLRLLCVDQRYEGKVVGLEPFSYTIVQVRLPQDTLSRLSLNPGVVAQLNAGGTLFGFRCDVVNRVSNPAPLLFLSHPDSVERVVLRRSERVDVTLPGTIHGAFGDHQVVLLDLAPSGCSFAARSNLKSPLRDAQRGERVVLRCDLGCGQPLMAPLTLRRIDEQKGRITMGGQFVDMTEDNSRLLHDYLQRMHGLLGD